MEKFNLSSKIFDGNKIVVHNVKEFISKEKQIEDDFELQVYGIVFAETGTDNTIKCLKKAFMDKLNKKDKLAGGGLI